MPLMLEWIGPIADRLWYWVLVGTLVALGLVEALWPARPAGAAMGVRWFTNLGLQAANIVLLTVLAPAVLAATVMHAANLDWQPMTRFAALAGDWPALLIGILVLDCYAYTMHRLQHAIFPLWRFHSVHHADIEMDVSTTLRHHPIEVLISTTIGGLLFAMIGIPEWIFPIYALLGITSSLIQHVNIGRPGRLDQALQAMLVTPGMHQVHHSSDQRDFNTNYGTIFSLWDRVFQTYRPSPARGRDAMNFGVDPFTDPSYSKPHWGLLLPFAIRREPRPRNAHLTETGADLVGERRQVAAADVQT